MSCIVASDLLDKFKNLLEDKISAGTIGSSEGDELDRFVKNNQNIVKFIGRDLIREVCKIYTVDNRQLTIDQQKKLEERTKILIARVDVYYSKTKKYEHDRAMIEQQTTKDIKEMNLESKERIKKMRLESEERIKQYQIQYNAQNFLEVQEQKAQTKRYKETIKAIVNVQSSTSPINIKIAQTAALMEFQLGAERAQEKKWFDRVTREFNQAKAQYYNQCIPLLT